MLPLLAQYSVADDLLKEATHGRLSRLGPIAIENSGLIGPLVELLSAAAAYPEEYQSVSFRGSFARRLSDACVDGKPFGGAFGAKAGVFPLPRHNPVIGGDPHWEQWVLHAENAAKAHGVAAELVASFIGALKEMQDNIYEHSEAAETGLIAYAVNAQSFEFVVSDRGKGVLHTLRQNPRYSDLPDAGAALREAIKPGVSRFPSETGRGQGYVQLYRSMVTHRAELRFRSGDHALMLQPTIDPLNGNEVLAHTASLPGLTIGAMWRA